MRARLDIDTASSTSCDFRIYYFDDGTGTIELVEVANCRLANFELAQLRQFLNALPLDDGTKP